MKKNMKKKKHKWFIARDWGFYDPRLREATVFLKIGVPNELLKRLKSTAANLGCDLNQWVITVLDGTVQSYEHATALLNKYVKMHKKKHGDTPKKRKK